MEDYLIFQINPAETGLLPTVISSSVHSLENFLDVLWKSNGYTGLSLTYEDLDSKNSPGYIQHKLGPFPLLHPTWIPSMLVPFYLQHYFCSSFLGINDSTAIYTT